MSYEQKELETISDIHADFDTFLSKSEWKNARACIDQMGELGYEMEALNMHKSYNRVYSETDLEYVPFTPREAPPLEEGWVEETKNYDHSSEYRTEQARLSAQGE